MKNYNKALTCILLGVALGLIAARVITELFGLAPVLSFFAGIVIGCVCIIIYDAWKS